MAVPYKGADGITALPETRLPDDYDHVQVNADQFGAQVGRGLAEAGAGATKASEFFGQVTADHAANEFQSYTDKLLHGDPTQQAIGSDGKPVIGPDGKPMMDTGFLGMKGEAATEAWPDVHAKIDAKMDELRSGLTTMEQMQQFDQFSKRYRSSAYQAVGSHADQQYTAWFTQVNQASETNAITHIANNAENPEEVAHGTSDLINARVKQLQVNGVPPDSPIYTQTVSAAKQTALKAQLESISVHQPDKAMEILEKNRALAGTDYEPLANQFRARATEVNGVAVGDRAMQGAHADLSAPAAPGAPGVRNAPGGGVGSPAAVIRHFEGFQSNAYWDHNHWRVGYGSDTVTNPDGSTSPVTAMTTVNRAGAERDLGRRAAQSQQQVQAAAGPAWDKLTPQAKASLASVAYNYGRVPDRIVPAIQSGDSHQIAEAIHNLGGDNNGINAKRRAIEASNVMGKFGLSGAEAMRGMAPTMTMPSAVAGTYHPTLAAMGADFSPPTSPTVPAAPPAWAGSLPAPQPASPAVPDLPRPIAPPVTAMPPVAATAAPTPPAADPLTVKAEAFQRLENDLSAGRIDQPTYDRAIAHVQRTIQNTMIEQEADAKSKADIREKAMDGYFKDFEDGKFEGKHEQIMNDPRLDYSHRQAAVNLLQSYTGERGNKTMGPGYTDALRRIFLPPGDPNRLSDPVEIMKMGTDGRLNPAAVPRVTAIMNGARRSIDTASVERTRSSMLSYVKDIFENPQPPLFQDGPTRINKQGKEKFESEFVPRLEAATERYFREGGDPNSDKSPLAKKNVDAMVEQVWPKRLRDKGQLQDTDEGKAKAEAAQALVMPPAPARAAEPAWTSLMQAPPKLNSGVAMSRADWSSIVYALIRNPTPQNIAAFNASRYGRAGYDANRIINQLYPAPAPAAAPQAPVSEEDELPKGQL